MNDRNKPTAAARMATWWEAMRKSGLADSMSEADLSFMAQEFEAGLAARRQPSSPDEIRCLIESLTADESRQIMLFARALPSVRMIEASA
jgi:hypothetical protein